MDTDSKPALASAAHSGQQQRIQTLLILRGNAHALEILELSCLFPHLTVEMTKVSGGLPKTLQKASILM